jgi:methyltransferase (TIGR00027 family)
VKADTPSRTAEYVAGARSLGRWLPPEAQLVVDPYGAAFAASRLGRAVAAGGDHLRALAKIPRVRAWILYMQVRTRVIDDELRAWLAAGGRQLVLLGAGYDCRALRLPELADARVLEVDHPATQARKRDVLAQLDAASPATYVTWDFETRAMDELPDALAAAGLDRAAPAFTIWEGVTMYLTEPAIDASLRAIAAWSATGSQLAMTYFANPQLQQHSLASRTRDALLARIGEPWRFGWAAGELPGYLAARGFELVRDEAMDEAARALLPASIAEHLHWGGRRTALARPLPGESVAFAAR